MRWSSSKSRGSPKLRYPLVLPYSVASLLRFSSNRAAAADRDPLATTALNCWVVMLRALSVRFLLSAMGHLLSATLGVASGGLRGRFLHVVLLVKNQQVQCCTLPSCRRRPVDPPAEGCNQISCATPLIHQRYSHHRNQPWWALEWPR